jgi:DNA replicative helicase MCM subunit Mcm2 (Cdc46/Mcm family)
MRHHGGENESSDLIPILSTINKQKADDNLDLAGDSSVSLLDLITSDPKANKLQQQEEDVFQSKDGVSKGYKEENSDLSSEDRSGKHTPKSGGKIGMIRELVKSLGEFTIQEFNEESRKHSVQEKGAMELLKHLIQSGEIYSPRKGWFRYVDDE